MLISYEWIGQEHIEKFCIHISGVDKRTEKKTGFYRILILTHVSKYTLVSTNEYLLTRVSHWKLKFVRFSLVLSQQRIERSKFE